MRYAGDESTMCGLIGIFSNSGDSKLQSVRDVKTALDLLCHRGPDQQKIIEVPNGYIGFNRLKIVGGTNAIQPFISEDGNVCLVCNGEIYNHEDLKKILKKHHAFKTKSDCEVILYLYEELGENIFPLLKGQFAVVIYDWNKKIVLAGRDRFGINPLFYAVNKGNIVFASEIKAILSLLKGAPKLNILSLYQTFTLYGVTPPYSIFQEVCQVPPASFVTFGFQTLKLETRKYWHFSDVKRKKATMNFGDQIEELDVLLKQAVKRRLQGAGIPGFYLSGGLDSSTIAWYLTALSEIKPFGFGIQFKNEAFNESVYQNLVIDMLKVPFFTVTGDGTEIYKYLYKTIWHTESPLSRLAPIPMYILSKRVNEKGLKYILCGEGADEILAGYPIFSEGISSIESKMELKHVINVFSHEVKKTILNYTQEFALQMREKNKRLSELTQSQIIETETKLSRYLLAGQGDRVSMAHSVEQRFPFLDEDLVDFILSQPDAFRMFNTQGKYGLKKLMVTRLPRQIIDRKKQGYLSPDMLMLPNSETKQGKELYSLLSDKMIMHTGYFDKRIVKNLTEKFFRHTLNTFEQSVFLFALTTQIFHVLFVDKDLSRLEW